MNLSPVEWLEEEFERGSSRTWAGPLVSVREDHDDEQCRSCQPDPVTSADGFWWRPPGRDHRAWYRETQDLVDMVLIGLDPDFPDPAEAFSRGPEYPTG